MQHELLYATLVSLYGFVRVHNEGVEGSIIDTERLGKGRYIARRASGGEQYSINCPICGDRRSRLYISHWAFKQVRSSAGVIDTRRLMLCHNEHCDLDPVRDSIERTMRDIGGGEVIKIVANRSIKQKKEPSCLPQGCVPINSMEAPIQCREYLESRGFDLSELYNQWQVMAVDRLEEYPEHGPKIIYPIICNGAIAFWQARLCFTPTKEQQHNGIRKYYFTAGSKKSDFLYNKDAAIDSLTSSDIGIVVLVEGVTDVHKVGPKGLAFFGKTPSLRQCQIIKNTPLSSAYGILLLDGDASEDVDAFMEKYSGDKLFDKGLIPIRLPEDQDPGDLSRESIWELILNEL